MSPQYRSARRMQCAGQQKTAALAITRLLTGTLAVNVAEDYLPHSHIISLGNLSLGGSVGRWKNSHQEVWSKRWNVFVFACHPSERFQKDF